MWEEEDEYGEENEGWGTEEECSIDYPSYEEDDIKYIIDKFNE